MITPFFRYAVRRLLKYKKHSSICILGLAVGLASFLIILRWVQDETSYDSFHEHVDEIYLITRYDRGRKSAITTKMFGPALIAEYPEIVNACSVMPLPDSFESLLERGDLHFKETLAFTDHHFFELFSFEFLEGDAITAFENPNSLILTETSAKKYFGLEAALGQTLDLTFLGRKTPMVVSAILKDLPQNTHINNEVFLPFNFAKTYGIHWDRWSVQPTLNYIQTNGVSDRGDLERKILACKTRNHEEKGVSYSLLPLKEIHLFGSKLDNFSTSGDIQYVHFFSAISVIILLIASMNYMNMSNALALKRMRDFGTQKIVGATSKHILFQHLLETLILTFVAMVTAILIADLVLPAVNRISGKQLELDFTDPLYLLTLLLAVFVTACISSVFPSLYIMGFDPIQAIRGKVNIGKMRFEHRNGLIILQFALTSVILVSTFVVFQQLSYMQGKNLGFDQENVVCIPLQGSVSSRYEAFRNQLLEYSNILSVCRTEPLNGDALESTDSLSWHGKGEKGANTKVIHVDSEFANVYNIQIDEGRFFDRQYISDATQSYVINEAARELMEMESGVGREMTLWGRRSVIVGVAKDFHYSSLHNAIQPLVFKMPDEEVKDIHLREIGIRIAANSLENSLKVIEKTWKSTFPEQPFDSYIYDEFLRHNYQRERKMVTLFGFFAAIAIFITCLGLYGLIAFSIEQKIKTIGIHKVHGASVGHICWMLIQKYLWLVLLSNAIGWPITYFVMSGWLENFAYRMRLTPIPFIGSATIVLLFACIAVGGQLVQAANTNPVTNLRNE